MSLVAEITYVNATAQIDLIFDGTLREAPTDTITVVENITVLCQSPGVLNGAAIDAVSLN